MTLEMVLVVAGALFSIGLFGVLARRNIIAVIMSLELMFNGVLVAAVGFSRFAAPAALIGANGDITESAIRSALTGHMFAVFVISIAAAETSLALALVFAFYRAKQSVEITDAATMKN